MSCGGNHRLTLSMEWMAFTSDIKVFIVSTTFSGSCQGAISLEWPSVTRDIYMLLIMTMTVSTSTHQMAPAHHPSPSTVHVLCVYHHQADVSWSYIRNTVNLDTQLVISVLSPDGHVRRRLCVVTETPADPYYNSLSLLDDRYMAVCVDLYDISLSMTWSDQII